MLDATGSVQANECKPYDGGHVGKVVFEQSMIIDKETLEPVVKVTERDIDKEIQSYKDECGIAFVLRQIAAGRLSIDQIKDDGKSGYDVSDLPETQNDAFQQNEAIQEEGLKAAGDLGMKTYTEAELNEIVAKAIKAAAEQKAAAGQNGGDK